MLCYVMVHPVYGLLYGILCMYSYIWTLIWTVIDCHGLSWTVMYCHGLLWTSMDSYGHLSTIMDSCGLLWTLVDSCGLLWTVMDCYGLLSTIMDSYGLLWTLMDFHGLLWTVTDCYGLLWTVMDFLLAILTHCGLEQFGPHMKGLLLLDMAHGTITIMKASKARPLHYVDVVIKTTTSEVHGARGPFLITFIIVQFTTLHSGLKYQKKNSFTRLKILPVLTREHYTSLLHWV
jgi:hypothetical protein